MNKLRKFCPSCGKDTGTLIEGICTDCFLKKTVILDVPAKIDAPYCQICGRILVAGEWRKYDNVGDALTGAARTGVTAFPKAKISAVFKRPEQLGPARIPVMVRVEAEIQGEMISDEMRTVLFLKPRTCDVCSIRRGGYFETIIQVRGKRQAEVFSFVQRRIKELAASDKTAYITKVEENKEGPDIYIGGKKPAQKVAEEAKRIYNAETKKSYTLAGEKEGKCVSRETILLRA